jgi:hypothetical protein
MANKSSIRAGTTPLTVPSNVIPELTMRLHEVLTCYISAKSADRDQLLQVHGPALRKLHALLYTFLTRHPEERAQLIMARQFFLAIEEDIEKNRTVK